VAKGSTGGRPPAFDPAAYRQRNVVERCFNQLKQFRGLATRYAQTGRLLPRRSRHRRHRGVAPTFAGHALVAGHPAGRVGRSDAISAWSTELPR
jgi:transposase